jgi:hypothetical protein
MPTRRRAMRLRVLAGLLFLTCAGGQQLGAPRAVHAQADSSRSTQRPAARPSVPAADGTPAIHELFRQQCVKCHGADGRGSAVRSALPEVPDFTHASWQERRSDAQLLAGILDGRGAPWTGIWMFCQRACGCDRHLSAAAALTVKGPRRFVRKRAIE